MRHNFDSVYGTCRKRLLTRAWITRPRWLEILSGRLRDGYVDCIQTKFHEIWRKFFRTSFKVKRNFAPACRNNTEAFEYLRQRVFQEATASNHSTNFKWAHGTADLGKLPWRIRHPITTLTNATFSSKVQTLEISNIEIKV